MVEIKRDWCQRSVRGGTDAMKTGKDRHENDDEQESEWEDSSHRRANFLSLPVVPTFLLRGDGEMAEKKDDLFQYSRKNRSYPTCPLSLSLYSSSTQEPAFLWVP